MEGYGVVINPNEFVDDQDQKFEEEERQAEEQIERRNKEDHDNRFQVWE